jgi:hypothetical protein
LRARSTADSRRCAFPAWRRAAAIRNAKRMTALFGQPEMLDRQRTMRGAYAHHGLAEDFGPFSVPALPPALRFMAADYLALDGDLHWLAPLDAHTVEKMGPRTNRTAEEMMQSQLDYQRHLLAVERRLRPVRLPPGFTRFMGDYALQQRVPSAEGAFFDMPYIMKLHNSCGARGYALEFYADLKDWYWYVCLCASARSTG